MGEIVGVLAAILSSTIGGIAAATTRFAMSGTDAVTLGALRFGGGFVLLLMAALALRPTWPRGRDWIGVVLLGLLFFGLFPILFNLALAMTSAARGALALSTVPVLTMVTAAALGAEPLNARKTVGVLTAMAGVGLALATGLDAAPPGAWRGDLTMVAGGFCMALYNVWSRPLIARSGAVAFTTAAMGVGALGLAAVAWAGGGLAAAADFGVPQWLAAGYLMIFGGALTFILWAFALQRTTPTRVASTITVNPISASILGALLLREPVGPNVAVGVVAVLAGIVIASTDRRLADGHRSGPQESKK